MDNRFFRFAALVGEEAFRRLEGARVIVFGAGGVGGYVIEALARAGVGAITIVDGDRVEKSNFNRQILATEGSLGRFKADAAAERVLEINPGCRAEAVREFYLPENADSIRLNDFDFVADAVDTVAAKLELAERCYRQSVPIISCMGTGNKLRPELLKLGDIFETSVCPLCRVMRHELKKRGVPELRALYSTETPVSASRPPLSAPFVPSVAGLLIAADMIKRLIRPADGK